jgi:hypothetical protein
MLGNTCKFLSFKNISKSTNNYKSSFYQKSLVVKTDFSLYRKQFKLWHPRYFDVDRRTEYQHKIRDYKKLTFNTQDPLHFDYNMKHINGGFERVSLKRICNLKNYNLFFSIFLVTS